MVTQFFIDDCHKYLFCFNAKIDLSYHTLIKDDIFEATVKFPPGGNHVSMISHYSEHHNMPYVSQSTNSIPWNRELHARNITNVCILII